MLRIQYFASVREQLGMAEELLQLPDGVHDVAGLVTVLISRGDSWCVLADTAQVLVALNQEVAVRTATLSENDEVAFFPPMTGG
jgi:molybdopterin synthase sulfur carrier subunit